MRRILIATCLAALGCSSSTAGSQPGDQPVSDAGADVLPDSGQGPDDAAEAAAFPDVFAEPGEASDGDAADCKGIAPNPYCDNGGCYAPKGCFLMGSAPDEPGHDDLETQVAVTFDQVIWIMRHEATIADWTAEGFAVPTPSTQDVGACTDPDCPVTGITLFEALAFANAYSLHRSQPSCYKLDGCTGDVGQGMVCQSVVALLDSDGYCRGYRVPTSAEWEYAARGGTTTAFYNGPMDAAADATACADDQHLDGIAWYCHNAGSPPSTHPAGQKQQNPLDLYDMAGNAAEWVTDEYPSKPLKPEPLAEMIASISADGPGQVRGGSAASPPAQCRSASRASVPKDARYSSIGFRLVQTFLPAQ